MGNTQTALRTEKALLVEKALRTRRSQLDPKKLARIAQDVIETRDQPVDTEHLARLVSEGKSVKEICKELGISHNSVYARMHEVKKRAIAEMAEKNTDLTVIDPQPVENCLDLWNQLKKINQYTNDEIEKVKANLDSDWDFYFGALEETDLKPRDRMKVFLAKEEQIRDWRLMLSKLSGDVKEQLKLQLQIAETYSDIKEFYEFRQEVLEVLDSVSPGIREEVLRKLRERRAIKMATKIM